LAGAIKVPRVDEITVSSDGHKSLMITVLWFAIKFVPVIETWTLSLLYAGTNRGLICNRSGIAWSYKVIVFEYEKCPSEVTS
jgi:hypothetical protein